MLGVTYGVAMGITSLRSHQLDAATAQPGHVIPLSVFLTDSGLALLAVIDGRATPSRTKRA